MKIKIEARPCIPAETLEAHRAYSTSLGLPMLGEARHPYLAIVGGGPSVAGHIDELRYWDGEIWAINGAYQFLRDRGVLSRFFTIDPLPGIAKMSANVDSAIMATICHPFAFDAAFHAYVETVETDDYPCGPTTASSAPIIALKHGYRRISFFGCEGSFGETTHAYENRNVPVIEVECKGRRFLTGLQMLHQSEYLAEQIRVAPDVLIDRSGGLLAALVANPVYDVTAASRSIYDAVMAA